MTSIFLFFIIKSCDSYIVCCSFKLCCMNIIILSRRLFATEMFIIKDKRFSFLVPLLSMLVSDVLYQALYSQGLTPIKGFYEGQWVNYILFTSITVIGFFIKKNKIGSIIVGSLAGAIFFYLTSNFFDWIGGGLDINNQPYPKTFEGLINCFVAGLPFFRGSVWATLLFNGIFFGCFYLYERFVIKIQPQAA